MPNRDIPENQIPVACFAPALTDEKLAEYEALALALPLSEVRDGMLECLAAVKAWWELPVSTGTKTTRWNILHEGKRKTYDETPLQEEHVKTLWDLVPYAYELKGIQTIFDAIPTEQKVLRDAAFHLLWHAWELCLDREPLTQDALK